MYTYCIYIYEWILPHVCILKCFDFPVRHPSPFKQVCKACWVSFDLQHRAYTSLGPDSSKGMEKLTKLGSQERRLEWQKKCGNSIFLYVWKIPHHHIFTCGEMFNFAGAAWQVWDYVCIASICAGLPAASSLSFFHMCRMWKHRIERILVYLESPNFPWEKLLPWERVTVRESMYATHFQSPCMSVKSVFNALLKALLKALASFQPIPGQRFTVE